MKEHSEEKLNENYPGEQQQQQQQVDNGTSDELGLCIDLMAARIRELELERERVKLDVILALRKQFENIQNRNGSRENLRDIFLNDSVCNIAVDEVEKCRSVELEKQSEMKAEYESKIHDLTARLSSLESENGNLSDSRKTNASRLDDTLGKLDRVQSRVSYLESLLRTVEKDNVKLKDNAEETETHLSACRSENTSLRTQLEETTHQLEVAASTDSKMKEFYEREREKMGREHKSLQDQLADTTTQLANSRQDAEKLLNSKETDISIIKHLEEKLKQQGSLLDNMSTDSTKYFELNMKLESKVTEYKQKLKKSAFGIESTHEENKRLKKERDLLENDKSALQRELSETKRRESNLAFQIKKLEAESQQKSRELDMIKKSRYQQSRLSSIGSSMAHPAASSASNGQLNSRNDASYAVLNHQNQLLQQQSEFNCKEAWNSNYEISASLGPVITSSVITEHAQGPRDLGSKLNLSPRNAKVSSLPYRGETVSTSKKQFSIDNHDGGASYRRSFHNETVNSNVDNKDEMRMENLKDSLLSDTNNHTNRLLDDFVNKKTSKDFSFSFPRKSLYENDLLLQRSVADSNVTSNYIDRLSTKSIEHRSIPLKPSTSNSLEKLYRNKRGDNEDASYPFFDSHKHIDSRNPNIPDLIGERLYDSSQDDSTASPVKQAISGRNNSSLYDSKHYARNQSDIGKQPYSRDSGTTGRHPSKPFSMASDTESGFEGSPVNGQPSPTKDWTLTASNGGKTSPVRNIANGKYMREDTK